MIAYPGAFRYEELVRLKKRDFELWAWKAQKRTLEKEMNYTGLTRIAMSPNDSYRRFYHMRETELLRLDGKLEAQHKEAWEALKIMKEG